MVSAFHHGIRTLLQTIGAQQRATGLEEFARAQPQGTRTIYRWHQELSKDFTYYPHLSFAALGLTHLHLFINHEHDAWRDFPYAIEGRWIARQPGERTLYLHCLIPERHRARVQQRIAGIEHCWSTDGWQTLADLHHALDEEGRPQPHENTTSVPPPAAPPTSIVAQHPLAVPVIFEMLGERRSMERIWRSIYDRLGPKAWSYLTRRTRRWPHNGKAYINTTLGLLNEHGIVRQHLVRYHALAAHTVEIFVRTAAPHEILERIRPITPVIEEYPTTGGALLRLTGDHRLIKELCATDRPCAWWFATGEEPVRFAYDQLFDPVARDWVSA